MTDRESKKFQDALFPSEQEDITARVRRRIMRQANILIAGAAFGFSACDDASNTSVAVDRVPEPYLYSYCAGVNNQEAVEWVKGTVQWESGDQERIILDISLLNERLWFEEGEQWIDGGEIVDSAQDQDIYHDLSLLIAPEEGVEVVVVTLSLGCSDEDYRTDFSVAVHVDLRDPDHLAIEVLEP